MDFDGLPDLVDIDAPVEYRKAQRTKEKEQPEEEQEDTEMKEAEQPQEEEQDSFRDEMLEEVKAKKRKTNEKLRELMTIDHQYLTATLDGLLSEYAQDLEQLHSPEKRLDASRDAEDLEWEEEFRGFPFSYKKQQTRRALRTEQAFGPLGLEEKARKELEDKWYSQFIDLMNRYKPPDFDPENMIQQKGS